MKKKFVDYFMNVAELTAQLSYAKRNKVGAVLVRDKRIILCGYNGTPPGRDNVCEESNVTKPEVMHAEENMFVYAAKIGISLNDCILFTTLSPCHICARLIFGAGIKTVYYKTLYRDTAGIDFLKNLNVEVIQIE